MARPKVPLDELARWHNHRPMLSYTLITKLINGSKPGRNFQADGLAQAARHARKAGDTRFPVRSRGGKLVTTELSETADAGKPVRFHW